MVREITDFAEWARPLSDADVQAERIAAGNASAGHWALRTVPRARAADRRLGGIHERSDTARRTEGMVLVPCFGGGTRRDVGRTSVRLWLAMAARFPDTIGDDRSRSSHSF